MRAVAVGLVLAGLLGCQAAVLRPPSDFALSLEPPLPARAVDAALDPELTVTPLPAAMSSLPEAPVSEFFHPWHCDWGFEPRAAPLAHLGARTAWYHPIDAALGHGPYRVVFMLQLEPLREDPLRPGAGRGNRRAGVR